MLAGGFIVGNARRTVLVLARQCLAQRIETKEDLERHVAAWEEERNERGDQIKWRFTTADARIKLRRLYPTL